MSEGSGVEFVGVATSTNPAYELVKRARESEYEVVDQSVPPVGPPPLPQEREAGYVNLPRQSKQSPASPSPVMAPSQSKDPSQALNSPPGNYANHPPAVAPSEGGKGEIEEEAVYEPIPGDQ